MGPRTFCAATPDSRDITPKEDHEAGEQSVETASKFSPQERVPKKPQNSLRHCAEDSLVDRL